MDVSRLFMKVCIPNKYGTWENSGTGKAFFIQRLIPELEKRGVEVTADPSKKVDITLGIGKFLYKPRSGKRVLRLGPCHFSTQENWKMLNLRKIAAVKKADGVIYQSEWSRKVCRKYLGKHDFETVIFNGGIAKRPIKIRPGKFVASTRTWIPQKRLKRLIKAFLLANIPGKTLDIYGQTPLRNKKFDGVTFYGLVPPDEIKLAGKIFLHPVYLDASPNAVVEALCAGCRVIHGSEGGTHELVGDNGLKLLDEKWDFKPINLFHPPKLDISKWAAAMELESDFKYEPVNSLHVNIKNIAKEYIDFFSEVIND